MPTLGYGRGCDTELLPVRQNRKHPANETVMPPIKRPATRWLPARLAAALAFLHCFLLQQRSVPVRS